MNMIFVLNINRIWNSEDINVLYERWQTSRAHWVMF